MNSFSSLFNQDTASGALSLDKMMVSFLLAFLLSSVLALVYYRTNRGNSKRFIMAQSLVLLSLTIVAAMSIIGDNIARAFGLIGAVSIIRFRTAVETSKDMTYILFSIIVGLACGIQFWMLAVVFTVILGLAILLGEWLMHHTSVSDRQVYRFRILLQPQISYDNLTEIFASYNVHVKLATVTMKRKLAFLTFTVTASRNFDLAPLIRDLQSLKRKKKNRTSENPDKESPEIQESPETNAAE